MSKPKEPRMISIDKALQDSWEWWQGLTDFQQEDYILKLYLEKHNITSDQIDF